jgi:putative FmdB family regulatory protein
MPTYEYVCTNCGHHVEVYQRFSEAPLATCGVCGGQLRKVFHPAGIVFKGSGFYATDSRTKAGSKDGAAKGDGKGDGGKGDGGKGDGAKETAKSKDASGASSSSSEGKADAGSSAPASKERSA